MRRLVTRMADAGLWVTAILGITVLAASVMLAASGARPVVVTSGSMGDAYPMGSVALVRQVDTGDVAEGDVLMVRKANGVKVLHRVVEVNRNMSGTQVVTKGDANTDADPAPVQLVEAWRAGAHVPYAGQVADFFRTPVAGFALALLLLGPLAWGRRTRGHATGAQPLPV